MLEGIQFDDKGAIPVWGVRTASGSVMYSFKLTDDDEFVMFPNIGSNPKAPKFNIKRAIKKEG